MIIYVFDIVIFSNKLEVRLTYKKKFRIFSVLQHNC